MKQIHGVRISHQTIINYVNGVSALVKDMIIITDYSIKLNTSKAKNDFDALIKFRKLYSDFLSSFSLSSIECTCGSHNWHMHSSYSRCYDFLGRKIKVSIQRIICASCGKTHALLIEDMIPFSTFTFSQIIDCLDDPDFSVDNFHRSFLINKYYNVEQNYRSYCQINRRNHMLIFLPT